MYHSKTRAVAPARGRLRRPLAAAAACALALAALTAGCGSSSDDAGTTGATGAKQEAKTVALSFPSTTFPFLVEVTKKVKSQLEAKSITLLTDNPDNKVANEVRDLDAWIARGDVATIMAYPIDVEAMLPVTQRANDAGIPVLGYSQNWEGTKAAMLTNPRRDGELLGANAAAFIKATYGDRPVRVAVLGTDANELTRERKAGMLAGLGAATNATIDEVTAFTQPEGFEAAKRQLVAHPDTKVWVSTIADTALGARKALIASGVDATDPSVYVGALDGTPEAFRVLGQEGDILRTLFYITSDDVAEAVVTLLSKSAAGEPVEDIVVSPVEVTSENAAEFE